MTNFDYDEEIHDAAVSFLKFFGALALIVFVAGFFI